jgi:hypothetical protein
MKDKARSKKLKTKSGDRPGLPEVTTRAEAEIDDAVKRIRNGQRKLDRKELHGSCGKQQLVETIYGAVNGLERHRLPNVIKRRLVKRLGDDRNGFDIVRGLIVLALPNLQSPVVTNWTHAVQLAQGHHVRPSKVRGFLYVKGGINRCADLYREQAAGRREEDENEEEETYRPRKPSKRVRHGLPAGMMTLYE